MLVLLDEFQEVKDVFDFGDIRVVVVKILLVQLIFEVLDVDLFIPNFHEIIILILLDPIE